MEVRLNQINGSIFVLFCQLIIHSKTGPVQQLWVFVEFALRGIESGDTGGGNPTGRFGETFPKINSCAVIDRGIIHTLRRQQASDASIEQGNRRDKMIKHRAIPFHQYVSKIH